MKSLLGDEIYIEAKDGTLVGPVKASVQSNKVYVEDTSLTIEEGGRILRTLPNGKSEVHRILECEFMKDSGSGRLSHYKIYTQKEGSLIQTPSSTTTINISHSQGIQIGDQNVQNIVNTFEMLFDAIESTQAPEKEKLDAKSKLKSLLSSPIVSALVGAAAKSLFEKLGIN